MTLEGQSQPNGLVFELGDPENYGIKAGEAQTIEFKNDQEIRKGDTLRIPVHFKRIQNFPEGQGIYQPGHFKLQTNVIANGTAHDPGCSGRKYSSELDYRHGSARHHVAERNGNRRPED